MGRVEVFFGIGTTPPLNVFAYGAWRGFIRGCWPGGGYQNSLKSDRRSPLLSDLDSSVRLTSARAAPTAPIADCAYRSVVKRRSVNCRQPPIGRPAGRPTAVINRHDDPIVDRMKIYPIDHQVSPVIRIPINLNRVHCYFKLSNNT